MDLTADERLVRCMLKEFRADVADRHGDVRTEVRHLAGCPDATVEHIEGIDSRYGCDTGCEYSWLKANIVCPHRYKFLFDYSDFGTVETLIEDMYEEGE